MKLLSLTFISALSVSVFASALVASAAQAQAQDTRHAIAWSEISDEGYYYLTQNLPLAEDFGFQHGEKFKWRDVTGSGGLAPVTVFELQANSCPNPEKETEMILLAPEGKPSGRDTAVGVDMAKNCVIEFFVEDADLIGPSFFTDSTE